MAPVGAQAHDEGEGGNAVVNLTRDDLRELAGAVVIVRWRHYPGFGKPPILSVGYGVIRPSGDVLATDKRTSCSLYLEELGKTWEARLLTDAPPEWEEP